MPAASSTQSNKKSVKQARRRFRWMMVFVLCFLGWAGVTYWDQQGKLEAKRNEVQDLNKQLTELKAQNEKALKEVERLGNREYIEQIIRKELNYTKEGETRYFSR